MRRKVTNFALDIEVHAVTCPGVWLCPDGDISVKIRIFNEVTETNPLAPVFPILYHENFTFQKLFPGIYFLTALQEALQKEMMYAELIQRPMSGPEIVLATFETTLLDLLYPSRKLRKTIDVHLLMDPSEAFPGILAPKIECSTRTTIEEIPLTESELHDVASIFLNSSKYDLETPVLTTIRGPIQRQRKVCHSIAVHEKKEGNQSFVLSKHEKSGRQGPFSIRNVDNSVNTYDSFLSSTKKHERRKDTLNSTALVHWTSVSGPSSSVDESPVRYRNTINNRRKSTKFEAGSSSSGDKYSTRWNNTKVDNHKKTGKIEIDPVRSVDDCGSHDTSSCMLCNRYTSFFEDKSISGKNDI